MHGRPPDDDAKRERDRLKQRALRKRQRKGNVAFNGVAPACFIAAMKARLKFFDGLTEEEAELVVQDKEEIAKLAYAVMVDWSPHWFVRKIKSPRDF